MFKGYIRLHTEDDFSVPGEYIWGEATPVITPVHTAFMEIHNGSADNTQEDDAASQTFAIATTATFAALYALFF